MVVNLELLVLDSETMVLVTMRPSLRPSRQVRRTHNLGRLPLRVFSIGKYAFQFDEPAVKIMFQVTQIVRFLLERGLLFRNRDLGFCGLGHDLI
jgi:hypothetical protein